MFCLLDLAWQSTPTYLTSPVSPLKFIGWSGHDGLQLKVQLQGQGAHRWWSADSNQIPMPFFGLEIKGSEHRANGIPNTFVFRKRSSRGLQLEGSISCSSTLQRVRLHRGASPCSANSSHTTRCHPPGHVSNMNPVPWLHLSWSSEEMRRDMGEGLEGTSESYPFDRDGDMSSWEGLEWIRHVKFFHASRASAVSRHQVPEWPASDEGQIGPRLSRRFLEAGERLAQVIFNIVH